MENDHHHEYSTIGAFAVGALLGVGVGLLLSREGSEIREKLKGYAVRALQELLEAAMDRGKSYMSHEIERSFERVSN